MFALGGLRWTCAGFNPHTAPPFQTPQERIERAERRGCGQPRPGATHSLPRLQFRFPPLMDSGRETLPWPPLEGRPLYYLTHSNHKRLYITSNSVRDPEYWLVCRIFKVHLLITSFFLKMLSMPRTSINQTFPHSGKSHLDTLLLLHIHVEVNTGSVESVQP